PQPQWRNGEPPREELRRGSKGAMDCWSVIDPVAVLHRREFGPFRPRRGDGRLDSFRPRPAKPGGEWVCPLDRTAARQRDLRDCEPYAGVLQPSPKRCGAAAAGPAGVALDAVLIVLDAPALVPLLLPRGGVPVAVVAGVRLVVGLIVVA